MSERYNGWTNYETWCVNLHLTNDEGSDPYWREAAQEVWDDAEADSVFSRSERARYDLADRLKDEVTEGLQYDELPPLGQDLLNAALSEVDWAEIADHFLEDVDGYEPVED